MKLGLLKDIKEGENRVILTPSEIHSIVNDGHEVYVQHNAGERAGFEDEEYEKAGAKILQTAKEIFSLCDFITKVKELEESEYELLKENQIIYTCLHPAAHPEEVQVLLDKKLTSITAEDTHRYGSPNCEAAGKTGAFMGLYAAMTMNNGMGKFVSGLGAAPNMNVLIIGCGTVGKGAIEFLFNNGANVTVMGQTIGHLRDVSQKYNGAVSTMIGNRYNLNQVLPTVDMVVNCVRWDKSNKDYMITREMVKTMKKGSVIVDISNDYGVIETFHETTHDKPMYIEEGVVHYCVSNIPSCIAQTASIAYAASVVGHIRNILNLGLTRAMIKDGYLRRGLVTYKGYLTHEETSQIQNIPWIQPEVILQLQNEELDLAPKNTNAVSENYYNLDELI